ncbi:hypothetical protein [Companilactobacillus ginsenosidimutans]|uniref:SCP domain-containing protein n=1 Tax=Companilactobacillus ginsenosidimutans TaxID=1007676 RepID=A0A0H4QMI8_9LACO|nr:hypothetical protein [Companilactobacillus ginsenosidimutans]AKP67898.1 hypothetical protein ABM34_10395 [Companilactobacillus ginsenosidimutans]
MKISKRVLSFVAVSAIVLPTLAPTVANAATDNTNNAQSTQVQAATDNAKKVSSYSKFNNGDEVQTVLPYDTDYVANTDNIQKYMEQYIDEYRENNGLQDFNWDQDTATLNYTTKRMGQLEANDGMDGHAGFYADNNKPKILESLGWVSDASNSDQETAYWLFSSWYNEINPAVKEHGHLFNMSRQPTNASIRVGKDTKGGIYVILVSGYVSGDMNVSDLNKMPTHTFIYE